MDESRQKILSSQAKVRLVEGRPGVGKTWFGCELAKHELSHSPLGVKPHQKILFLTFARNAVARIREVLLPSGERNADKDQNPMARVRIDTFCGFFWWLVDSYGRYCANGTTARLWLAGSRDIPCMVIPNGYEGYTFDKVQSKALELLQIPALFNLIADLYPLIIIDEFQDVHDRLVDVIAEFARHSRMVLLRGPGQCIYRNLPGKEFDPDNVLKRCITQLMPERFELVSLGGTKQRYARETEALITQFESGCDVCATTVWPIRLCAIERIPQSSAMEVCAGLLAHSMMTFLKHRGNPHPTIAVLASTNQGTAAVHTRITKGHGGLTINGHFWKLKARTASLLLNDGIFLQYGRLMLRLLKAHWIAMQKEAPCPDETAACIASLFQEQQRSSAVDSSSWRNLANLLIGKVQAQQPPRNETEWEGRLRNNLLILNNWLRATQGRLRRENITDCPRRAFDAGDTSLLNTLRDELIEAIRNHVTPRGRLDSRAADVSFEKTNQQKVLFEKLGIQKSIQVMTIHKSKGREFDGVVLLLEDSRSAVWRDDINASQDEVEDLYRVAVSRARSALAVVAFKDAWKDAAVPVRRLLPEPIFAHS
ncbi:MAG: ATP-dependent helicase [Phycisphaerales bacterium]